MTKLTMLLLSLTMAACSSAKFNSNSDRKLSPKQQNCAFKISNTVPKEVWSCPQFDRTLSLC